MKKSNRETTQTEQHFLQEYDPQQFPPVAVAVDLLVFTIDEGVLKLLMVRREEMPFQGMLALPGVFVGIHETLDQAAARGIREEAGLENIYFEQLYTWGGLERDPRMRIISVSYLALVPVEKLSIGRCSERDNRYRLRPWRHYLLRQTALKKQGRIHADCL